MKKCPFRAEKEVFWEKKLLFGYRYNPLIYMVALILDGELKYLSKSKKYDNFLTALGPSSAIQLGGLSYCSSADDFIAYLQIFFGDGEDVKKSKPSDWEGWEIRPIEIFCAGCEAKSPAM